MSSALNDATLAVTLVFGGLLALAAWSTWVVRRRRRTGSCPDCGCDIDRRNRTLCVPCLIERQSRSCSSCRRQPSVAGEDQCLRCLLGTDHGLRRVDRLMRGGR